MKHPRPSSRSGDFSSEPQPLAATDEVASQILHEASAEYQAGLDEAGAWNRLRPTLEPRQRRTTPGGPRWPYAALGIAAAAAVLLLVLQGVRSGRFQRAPEAAVAPAHAPQTPAVSPAEDTKTAELDEIVEATPARRPLSHGRTRLSDGSVVHLHPASAAAVSAERTDRTTIDLSQGTVELEVAHQSAGRRLEVVSGVYRFVALGTAFRVSTVSGQVDLEVTEGTVGVVAGGRTLAKVEAGKSWKGDPSAPPETSKGGSHVSAANPRPPEPSAPALAIEPDCAVSAREGRTREAIFCYERQAEKSGMSAELAMYEIARLKRDVLSDFSGALDALRSYEARFPRGTLRGEVEVSILGLLQKLGRSDEALSESERLLQTAWGKERAPAIHLLRGNIFRQSLHDCARAEQEYATLSDDPSASGDEAQFWRADCFERTARRDAAARTYDAYLRRPHPRHAAEAKARLLALAR